MNCEQSTDWFGDAVDGTLSPEMRRQMDEHCRGCETCRHLLNDLMAIRAAASSLDRLTPSPGVWDAIAKTVRSSEASHRSDNPDRLPRWGALAAAALLLMALGTAAWLSVWPAGHGGAGESAAELARAAASELQLAEQHYLNAIASLEQLTANKENALEPAVAAGITQGLQSIDRAIDDSRAALKSEPGSFVAQTSLLEALRMKVALLQETISLMNASS